MSKHQMRTILTPSQHKVQEERLTRNVGSKIGLNQEDQNWVLVSLVHQLCEALYGSSHLVIIFCQGLY
jgi:hypothetical protein